MDTHAHSGQRPGEKAILAVVPACASQAEYRRPGEVDVGLRLAWLGAFRRRIG